MGGKQSSEKDDKEEVRDEEDDDDKEEEETTTRTTTRGERNTGAGAPRRRVTACHDFDILTSEQVPAPRVYSLFDV